MRRIVTAAALLVCVTAMAVGAPARGTAAQARAMLVRAVTALKVDPVEAVRQFNQADGGFRDRDLYVACFDARTGIVRAHVDPKQLGVDIRTLKQPDGKPFGRKLFDAAKTGTIASVDYDYVMPGGTAHVAKRSYVTRVGNEGCLVGYYK